ncbi:MAG: hypothetical protein IT449_11285 [Phycisphaerales bacterium]|nr:hypothetical protein [Phycisphaerales bacterium]
MPAAAGPPGAWQRSRAQRPHPVFWVIATALSIIAVTLLARGGGGPSAPAWAQPLTGGGSRGVFAFSGQLASGAFGVYMVDVDSMTIWCYEYQKERGCMRLAAARSWKYDRYLEQFNVCDITPADVERLIEDQRAYKQSDGDVEK